MCPKQPGAIFPEWKGVVKPRPTEAVDVEEFVTNAEVVTEGQSCTSYEGEILVANPVVRQGGRHVDPISGEQVGRIIEDGCAVVMFKQRALTRVDVLTLIDELQQLAGMMVP